MASKLDNPNKIGNPGCNITNDEELRIVMVAKTGNGKSAAGNTILGRQCFESKLSAESLTVDCSKGKAVVDGQQVAVIDTPGLFDTRFGEDETAKDLCQCITYAAPGPHVFLVIIKLGRYTKEEKQTVKKIQEMFGEAADKYSMVLFTRGDELRETTIEEFLSGSRELQELVDRCNGMYHVFNNMRKDHSQVTKLLQKIRNLVQKNGGSHYTNEMFQEAERANEKEKQRILKKNEEQRRKEMEALERELKEKYENIIKNMTEQLQAESERERKEREEERKREKQEMEEEKKRERQEMEEEKKRERQEMEEEREREKKEREEERQREKKETDEEREREKKEREEEREREKKEREEERQREKKEREEERQRERAEKEKELENMKNEFERERKEQKEKLQSLHEKEAREKAEESNPMYHVKKVAECSVGVIKHTGKAVWTSISWTSGKFMSVFGKK